MRSLGLGSLTLQLHEIFGKLNAKAYLEPWRVVRSDPSDDHVRVQHASPWGYPEPYPPVCPHTGDKHDTPSTRKTPPVEHVVVVHPHFSIAVSCWRNWASTRLRRASGSWWRYRATGGWRRASWGRSLKRTYIHVLFQNVFFDRKTFCLSSAFHHILTELPNLVTWREISRLFREFGRTS